MTSQKIMLFFLVDTSNKALGEPINAINTAIRSVIHFVKRENVYCEIICFDNMVSKHLVLTQSKKCDSIKISASRSPQRNLGAAFSFTLKEINAHCIRDRKLAPNNNSINSESNIILFINEKPNDMRKIESLRRKIKNTIKKMVILTPGNKNGTRSLAHISHNIFNLDTMDAATISNLLKPDYQ